MANFIVTPNMNLPNPVPTVDPGPDYATNLQSSLNLIDQHNHTAGSGVLITTAAININANLPFNSQAAVGVGYVGITTQGAGVPTPVNYSLYFSGLELFVKDGAGNAVQITSGGNVNATSSGISSGTNTASFVGSVLVVNADTNKPANIQGASLLLGNNVTNSNYLTLSPPNALGSSYGLVLPPVPVSTLFMTLDSSGNMVTASSIQPTQIAAGSVTRAQLVSVGQQVSSSCGTFSQTVSTTFVAVTNLSVTLTTSGNPVMVLLQPDGVGATAPAFIFVSQVSGTPVLRITNGTTDMVWQLISSASTGPLETVPSFSYLDTPAAGTYTYSVSVKSSSSVQIQVSNLRLVAYEIK